MTKVSKTTGVVLAGGRSSRFGSNKAFATVDDSVTRNINSADEL